MNVTLESATTIARRIVPGWQNPQQDAHYRDVKREIQSLIRERELLARLADPNPQFYNPLAAVEAQALQKAVIAEIESRVKEMREDETR